MSLVRPGRPPSTTRSELARIALELFVRQGFDETTVDDVAEAAGVGRRTVFRYYASKNDMVWGEFDRVLDRLRAHLDAEPPDADMLDALGRAVVASNHYEPDQLPELRVRMTLITTVPALQAHSMVRYAEWRAVVSEFVAARLGQRADDLVPLTIGQMALAASMSAFVRWVEHPQDDLEANLELGYRMLARVWPLEGR
jgi:TetR/AcrR family transcriptional regulator, regulator of mycofactocin system